MCKGRGIDACCDAKVRARMSFDVLRGRARFRFVAFVVIVLSQVFACNVNRDCETWYLRQYRHD